MEYPCMTLTGHAQIKKSKRVTRLLSHPLFLFNALVVNKIVDILLYYMPDILHDRITLQDEQIKRSNLKFKEYTQNQVMLIPPTLDEMIDVKQRSSISFQSPHERPWLG